MRCYVGWLAAAVLVISGCGGGGSGSINNTPPPPTPPSVSAVTPASGSTGIAITTAVTASFSEAMTASTINASTFTLVAQGGSAVGGTVIYSAATNTATLTPPASLAYATSYTATITTGAASSGGAALAANYTWSFTTAPAPPPPPPTVSAVSPANGSTGVSVNTPVTATFSVAMAASTITWSSFTLSTQAGGAVTASNISYNSATMTATFTSAAPLAYSTTYIATVTTGVSSSAGASLAANYTWTFTTVPAPGPSVTSTLPVSGATNIAVSQSITATFSQAMDASTINSSTFTVADSGGTGVAGTVTYSSTGSTATFSPASPLAYNTNYTATLTTGIKNTGGAALSGNYVWSFKTAPAASMATIDFSDTYQTIRGFGGSTAWLGQLTTQQATALFDPVNGLGLNILRVRIDPQGSATNNWQTGQWTTELNNARAVQQANPNAIVFASPWTPPPSMKNSSTAQPYYSGTAACSPGPNYCGGYLDPGSYPAYATYLEDFVTYFASNGVSLYAISMQNEPDFSGTQNYESCSWTAAQMDTWIAHNASALTTRLIMPESFSFNKAISDPALQDASAASLISILGEHLYGVSNPLPNYSSAQAAGKEVWMTEHSLTPSGSQPAIIDALAAAEEIHNSLTTGGYNAYVWWWIWDNPNDNINYGLINSSTTSPVPTAYGYALGQFARFVQPGYVRVSATGTLPANVYVSAYKGNGHTVIVVINAGTSAPSVTFALNNATVASVTPYQTTSSGGLVQQVAIGVSNGQFTYTLPAQSIVTFVQ